MITATALLATLIFAGASSEARAPEFDFAELWRVGKRQAVPHALGPTEFQVFERFVPVDGRDVSIGSVVTLKIPKNPQANYAPEQVAQTLLKNLGVAHWSAQRRQKQAHVFEANWAALHRYVRFYLVENADSFSVSVAMFRPSYAETVAIESELIQRHLAGVLDTPIPSLKLMTAWLDRLIPSAHAECPGCSPTNPAACGNCVQANQATALDNSFNNSLNGAVNNADGKANNIADRNVDKVTGTADNNVNKALSLVPGNEARVDRALDQTDRMVAVSEKLVDPKAMYVVGFAAAAGAATGALVVNLVSQGFVAGTEALIEEITHAQRDAQLNAAFVAARDKIEKLYEDVATIETDIDVMDNINSLIRNTGTKEYLLRATGTHREKLAAAVERRQRQLQLARDQNASSECIDQQATELFELRQKLKTVSELVENIDRTTEKKVCQRIKDDLAKLKQVENLLGEMRSAISAGENAWDQAWQKKYAETSKSFMEGEKLSTLEKVRDRSLERAKDAKAQEFKRLQSDMNEAYEQCWKGDCPAPGRFVSSILFLGPLGCPTAKRLCQERIRDLQNVSWGKFAKDIRERVRTAKETEARALRDAQLHFEAEKALALTGVAAQSKVNYDAYKSIKDWILEQKRAQAVSVEKSRTRDLLETRVVESCKKYW